MRKAILLALLMVFTVHLLVPPACSQMKLANLDDKMFLNPVLHFPSLLGLKAYQDDQLRFDFIMKDVDKEGDVQRIIRYFLAALTVPEKDLWVNLSPYEKNRIVPEDFGKTEMGRDLLLQDYLLKSLTASLMSPDGEVGKKFWGRIYKQVQEKFGTTDIPLDTFNKVWIAPDRAVVFENKEAAYVVESRLKVMLESDYVAIFHQKGMTDSPVLSSDLAVQNAQIIREVILPEIEKEVNHGEDFLPLRQIYHSLILAAWYKRKVMGSNNPSLMMHYVDKNKIAGIGINNPKEYAQIWTRYVQTFNQGAYSLVREEKDIFSEDILPRKYFAGGLNLRLDNSMRITDSPEFLLNRIDHAQIVAVRLEEERAHSNDVQEDYVQDGRKLMQVRIPYRGKMITVKRGQEGADNFEIWFDGERVDEHHEEDGGLTFHVRYNQNHQDELVVSRFYIKHVFQGNGIGSRIFQWLLGYAYRKGIFYYSNWQTQNPDMLYMHWKMLRPETERLYFSGSYTYCDKQNFLTALGGLFLVWQDERPSGSRMDRHVGIRIERNDAGDLDVFVDHKKARFIKEESSVDRLKYIVGNGDTEKLIEIIDGMRVKVSDKKGTKYTVEYNKNVQIKGELRSPADMAMVLPDSVAARKAELKLIVHAIKEMYPASPLRFENASEMPMEELVSDAQQSLLDKIREEDLNTVASSLEDEWHDVNDIYGKQENRLAYWANQHDVRTEFLRLVQDYLMGQFNLESFSKRLKAMHEALLLGANKDSIYVPNTLLGEGHSRYYDSFEEEIRDRIAGRYSLGGDTYSRIEECSINIFAVMKTLNLNPGDLNLMTSYLARFYIDFMGYGEHQGYLFEFGNNSLAMNMINGFLRLAGLKGISHGDLDFKLLYGGAAFIDDFARRINNVNTAQAYLDRAERVGSTGGIDLRPVMLPVNVDGKRDELTSGGFAGFRPIVLGISLVEDVANLPGMN